jgi:RIO-like serine/threonine protein kinase
LGAARIADIEDKTEWFVTPYSKFYKVRVGGEDLVLKEVFDPLWPISRIIKSYENCVELLADIEEIVKVHDFAVADRKALILMDNLEDYKNLINVVVPSKEFKDNILQQILNIFLVMWNKGLINYDLTIINFMIKGDRIKMIDLEFVANVDKIDLFRMLWFFERIDVIKNWHGDAYDTIMEIKMKVANKWRNAT